eukprot:6173280-Pleurochrysis_carterae.AAC.2
MKAASHHITNGGFAPSVWACWASVSHTSSNALKVLREMTCNQRADNKDSSGTNGSSSEDSNAENATGPRIPKQ